MFKSTCRLVGRLFRDEDGPTTTEYSILLALIMLTMFLAIQVTGTPVKEFWEDSGNGMNSAFTSEN